ncbi:MAG: hypothetical protein CMC82_03025 [Flavobacteriaceae bacterium]|nr:hypothetical protein [Flavobacteriaceae bacterium]
MIKKRTLLFTLVLLIASCEKKFNYIGAEALPTNPFVGKKVYYPVGVKHALVDVVQTNNTSPMQLGVREDKLFGNTAATIVSQLNLSQYAPSFGALSAQSEIDDSFDESEMVNDVWLEIPFFTSQTDADGDGLIDIYDIDDTDPNSDSDGDGVSDIDEKNNGTDPTNPDTDGDGIQDGEDTETVNPNPDKRLYDIDSLFGDREASFDIEIHKLNYFLRQLDPNQNFEQGQIYYSDFSSSIHQDQLLANENITLDFNEIVKDSADNLSPRIRVPLNKQIFQQLILDKEGDSALASSEDWRDFFRSISIETSNFSSPLLMLLDTNSMVIRIDYTFKSEDANSDTAEIEDKTDEFLINTLGSIRFNTLTKTTTAAAELNDIVSATLPDQIALSGGLGMVADIQLFEDNDVLEDLKGRPWLLNEANLTFHVDKQAVNFYGHTLPNRLYLYNANTLAPIIDFAQDGVATHSMAKIVYGGFLTNEEEGDKQYYKVRITDYLKNIISNDSINAPLRVALTNVLPNQTEVPMAKVNAAEVRKIPAGSVTTPKPGVFVGPNPSNPDLLDLKLQLEIFYTEINQ